MAEDLTAALAKEIRTDDEGKTFRRGVVTSIAGIFAVPRTIAVDGRSMRFIGNADEYDVGDTVIFIAEGATPWVLGSLNNGANVGWGRSVLTHRDGFLYLQNVNPSNSAAFNLYPASPGSLNIPDKGGANMVVTLVVAGTGEQQVTVSADSELDDYLDWEFVARPPDSATGWVETMTMQFYRDFASPDPTWQPKIRVSIGTGPNAVNVRGAHVSSIFQAFAYRGMAI